jgi:hypothetical protein
MDAIVPPAAVVEPQAEERPAAAPPESEPAPRAHAVDLGVGTFILSGVATGGVVGFSPFVTDELGRDVFVRIAASVGQGPASGLHLTWVTGRLDICSESLGNYAEGAGLRLDLCGGADAGATFIASGPGTPAQSPPFIDIGPSVDLRAEVGPSAAVLLRVAAGLSIARDMFVDSTGATYEPPLATINVELAFSWTVPSGPSKRSLVVAASKPR